MKKSAVKPKTALTPRPEPKRKDNLPEILSPSVDVVFKRFFGDERNKDILANFLTEVLGFKIIPSAITLVDPHLKRNYPKDKLGILDVMLKLRNRKIINIEMQVGNLKDIHKRVEYYISKITADQLKKGDKYSKITPVVMILITKKTLLAETEDFHNEFGMLEKKKHFELHDLRTIHILELSKLPKRNGDKLVDWLKFINAEKKEEFMTLTQECRHLSRALEALEETSANQRTRYLYEARLKAIRDEWARIDYGRDEGLKEGLKKGREEGRIEGGTKKEDEILLLIEKGRSADEIRKTILSQRQRRRSA